MFSPSSPISSVVLPWNFLEKSILAMPLVISLISRIGLTQWREIRKATTKEKSRVTLPVRKIKNWLYSILALMEGKETRKTI